MPEVIHLIRADTIREVTLLKVRKSLVMINRLSPES